jgi:hypothetical protein
MAGSAAVDRENALNDEIARLRIMRRQLSSPSDPGSWLGPALCALGRRIARRSAPAPPAPQTATAGCLDRPRAVVLRVRLE